MSGGRSVIEGGGRRPRTDGFRGMYRPCRGCDLNGVLPDLRPARTARDGAARREWVARMTEVRRNGETDVRGAIMSDYEVGELVGLGVEEARRRVEAGGWRFRIMKEDGVGN